MHNKRISPWDGLISESLGSINKLKFENDELRKQLRGLKVKAFPCEELKKFSHAWREQIISINTESVLKEEGSLSKLREKREVYMRKGNQNGLL